MYHVIHIQLQLENSFFSHHKRLSKTILTVLMIYMYKFLHIINILIQTSALLIHNLLNN